MRQFVCPVLPNSKGLLEIIGKDFHYLRKVLRMAPGDMMTLSLPGGRQQEATICKADDAAKKITLQICDSQGENPSQAKNLSQAQDCAARSDGTQAQNVRASRTQLSLLQFIPKPQKMELIVRQATECGVANIVPVIGEYTQAGFEKALQKSDRFEKINREARQQSGSQVETKIFPPQKLSAALDLVDQIAPNALKIFLYERTEGTQAFGGAVSGYGDAPGACVYAVGCEGGISPAEAELLLARGFKAVHFNTNILRCETASLYAAAAIQSALDN